MDNHDRELSKTEEWFREKLHDTVNYGLAALTMIGGWLMSNDSIISIQQADNAEKQEAAVILGILLPCLWFAWYASLRNLHNGLPTDHPTILTRRSLHLIALGSLVFLVVLWCVAADVVTFPTSQARP